MRFFHFFAGIIGCAGALAPLTLLADGRDDRGGARVTFYEHADFRGGSITVHVGDSLENLGRAHFTNGERVNDRISSIRIEGAADVLVYRDAGFRGEVRRIDRSVRNLGDDLPGWNDEISSVRVERESRRGPEPAWRDRDRPRMDPRQADRIITRAYRDILQRDPDSGGLRWHRQKMVDEGLTEEQLRAALRQSGEYRTVVDRIVTKAYRDLLGRDPDPSGRQSFSEHMLKHGWSEEDVRNAIRRSDEYRARQRDGH